MKVATMKTILKVLNKKNLIPEFLGYDLEYCDNLYEIDRCNKICGSSPQKLLELRENPNRAVKRLALILYYDAPDAYHYIRQHYETAFPPPEILSKWWTTNTYEPGLTGKAFELLKRKSVENGRRLICALAVDDLSINGHTYWDGCKTHGLVDIGVPSYNDEEEIAGTARSVLINTLICLEENWKIPIGYLIVKTRESVPQAVFIQACLRESYLAGVDVVAVSLDYHPGRAIAKALGCNLDNVKNLKTTFKHPESDREVAVFMEPHELKRFVRISLISGEVLFAAGREIKQEYLDNLENLQNNKTLEFAGKVTPPRLELRKQIVKVHFTSEILSNDAGKALKLCADLSRTVSTFQNTEGTIEFITCINKLFDILSSRANGTSGYKQPLSRENKNEIFRFLDDVTKYILSIRASKKVGKKIVKEPGNEIVSNEPRHGALCDSDAYIGFLVDIKSLKHLYKTLVEKEQRLPFIATERLSQNHAKAILNKFRKNDGDEPTAFEVKKKYKNLFESLDKLRSGFANSCLRIENLPQSSFSTAISNITKTSGLLSYDPMFQYASDDEKRVKPDAESSKRMKTFIKALGRDDSLTDCSLLIIGYISGWLVNELIKDLRCETCMDALVSNEKQWFHQLICITEVSGICLPTKDVFGVCAKANSIVTRFCKEKPNLKPRDGAELKRRILYEFLDSDVFQCLFEHSKEQPPMFNHRLHLLRAIIDKFVNERIPSICRKPVKRSSRRNQDQCSVA